MPPKLTEETLLLVPCAQVSGADIRAARQRKRKEPLSVDPRQERAQKRMVRQSPHSLFLSPRRLCDLELTKSMSRDTAVPSAHGV